MGEVLPIPDEAGKEYAGVTALQKRVITLMVHEGMSRRKAAEAAKTSDRNCRYMFRRPEFLRAYRRDWTRRAIAPSGLHRRPGFDYTRCATGLVGQCGDVFGI